MSLLSPKEWTYTFWPVTTWSWEEIITSEAIDVKVTGERIMVNNKFDTIQKNLWVQKSEESEEDEEQNIDDVVLDNNIQSWSEVEIIPKKILWVDGEEMTDIYREKWFLTSYALLKKILTILILIALVVIWFFVWRKYLNKYLQSRKEALENAVEEIIEEIIEIDYQNFHTQVTRKYPE